MKPKNLENTDGTFFFIEKKYNFWLYFFIEKNITSGYNLKIKKK